MRGSALSAAVAAAALVMGTAACGTSEASEHMRAAPLTGEPLGRGESSHPTTPAATDATTTTAPAAPAAAGADDDLATEVTALLGAYDRALTALAAQPGAAADPAHPLTLAWSAVVTPASALDQDMRSRLLAQAADGVVIHADTDGLAWRDHARAVRSETGGTVTWENCGFSPGVGVDATTGAVRDDRRASTRGHGRAHRGPDGHLVLDELVQDSLETLGSEATDPCESGGWR